MTAVQRIGDELGRQAAPRQRGAGGDHERGAAAVPPPEDQQRQHRHEPDAGQDRGERDRRRVAGRGLRGDGRQQHDAREDPADGQDLARADGLVQPPRADDQQEHEAEGQRGLDHHQRGQQQRGRLQRPPQDVERGAGQPPAPAHERQQQRRVQALVVRDLARVERLERQAQVVQRGRAAARGGSEEHRRHERHAP